MISAMVPNLVFGQTILRHTMIGALLSSNAVLTATHELRYELRYELRHERSALQDSTPLSTITTDTGAFAPGNRDFTQFTVPDMCAATAVQNAGFMRRSVSDQLAQWRTRLRTVQDDTLPTHSRALARACGARFTVGNTAATDLPGLFRLALLMDNDTLAHAVMEQRVALAPSAVERRNVFLQSIQGYLNAHPARVAAAERVIARMDTLQGELSDVKTRSLPLIDFYAHVPLVAFAQNNFDRVLMQREADLVLAKAHVFQDHGLSPIDSVTIRRAFALAYISLLELARVDHPDSVLAIATRARDAITPLLPDSARPNWASPADIVSHLMSDALPLVNDTRYPVAPAVEVSSWFPVPPPHWPPRDQVTLVLYGMNCPHQGTEGGMLITYFDAELERSDGCSLLDKGVPDWLASYGHHGFGVTIVETTAGYAVMSGLLAPPQEADSIAWFYRTYRQLPVTVGVVRSAWPELMPRPDGRHRYEDTTAMGTFLNPQHGWSDPPPIAILYARDGSMLYEGEPKSKILDVLITAAMQTSAGAGHASVSTPPVLTPGH